MTAKLASTSDTGGALASVVPIRQQEHDLKPSLTWATAAAALQQADLTTLYPHLARLYQQTLEVLQDFTKSKEKAIAEAVRFSTANERTHLPDSQIVSLIAAYLVKLDSKYLGYSDVLAFSMLTPRPLSDRTIYAAVGELEDLGLLRRVSSKDAESAPAMGRPRELFEITDFGVIALHTAVTYARHIDHCRAARRAA